MKLKRILLGTDFSECSTAALEFASRLASDTAARLYIVHVDGLLDVSFPSAPSTTGSASHDAPWGIERSEIRKRLVGIVPTVARVAHEHHYLTGPPVLQILRLAQREKIDLIVIGSHGRTGIFRQLMGSVAEGIVRNAKCPVLIVKQPATVSDKSVAAASTGTQ